MAESQAVFTQHIAQDMVAIVVADHILPVVGMTMWAHPHLRAAVAAVEEFNGPGKSWYVYKCEGAGGHVSAGIWQDPSMLEPDDSPIWVFTDRAKALAKAALIVQNVQEPVQEDEVSIVKIRKPSTRRRK